MQQVSREGLTYAINGKLTFLTPVFVKSSLLKKIAVAKAMNILTVVESELKGVNEAVPGSVPPEGQRPAATIRFGIARKIAVLTTIIVTLTMIIVAFYVYRNATNQLVERETSRLSTSIVSANAKLADRIKFAREDASFLSQTPAVRGISRALGNGGIDPVSGLPQAEWERRLSANFVSMLESRPAYIQLRYIGIADGGREIVRVELNEAGEISRIPSGRLQRKADLGFFREAAQLDNDDVYISDFEFNDEFEKAQHEQPVFRAATPVTDGNGVVRGMVVVNADAHFLSDLVGQDALDTGSFIATNQGGDYIAHPDATKTFGFDRGTRYRLQDDIPELAGVVTGGQPDYSGVVTTSEGKMLVVARRVYPYEHEGERHLVLATKHDYDSLVGKHPIQRIDFIILALILVFSSAVLAMLFARAIVKPLHVLTAAAGHIADGDAEVDIESAKRRTDEIGVLARAFQIMMERVEQREREVSAKAEELALSNEELSQFAYVASHDLQEPLRMVGSYLGLLVRRYGDTLDGEAKEFIAYAVDGAERMKRLINDLLGYSRVSNRPLDIEPVDLDALVGRIVRSLEDETAEFVVDPLPRVEADSVQIERLFLNLIDNAIKYRSGELPKICVSAERINNHWEFTVTDNGIGIEPEFEHKIFDIFTRLHSREKYQGTGIGLASCRRIVERHGGTIAVEPNPQGGSIFRFTLAATEMNGDK